MLGADEQDVGEATPFGADEVFGFRRKTRMPRQHIYDTNVTVGDGVLIFVGIQRLAERCVNMDWSRGGLNAQVDRFVDDPVDRPEAVGVLVVLRQLEKFLYVLPV